MTTKQMAERVRINRLRRMADRQGVVLSKSRRRDPSALDYQCWRILDTGISRKKLPIRPLTLDEVENWLTQF
jgi:hypothetical protein